MAGMYARSGVDLEAYILHSVNLAGGVHTNGNYATCAVAKLESEEEAKEVKRQLYNARMRLERRGQKYGLPNPDIVKAEDGTWQVHFRVTDKAYAYQAMLDKYGSPENFPYNPWRKKRKKNS